MDQPTTMYRRQRRVEAQLVRQRNAHEEDEQNYKHVDQEALLDGVETPVDIVNRSPGAETSPCASVDVCCVASRCVLPVALVVQK